MEAQKRLSPADYLALDASSERKYEYWNGFIIAMAGAEPKHNLLSGNIFAELRGILQKRGCQVFTSDQRVQLDAKYVYPDVVMSCKPEFAPTRPQSLLNPELIVEVSSPSTMSMDRRDKLTAYMQMESLKEYWIADPERVLIHQYIRDAEGWRVQAYSSLDATIHSPHFDLTLSVRDCYVQVIDRDEDNPPLLPDDDQHGDGA